VKTKKTELLFVAHIVRILKNGGRAAIIVPDGVLFGSSKAHKDLRRMLVEEHKLDAVVKLPSGVFKPYAGVSTAILFFTKTSSGGTDSVWFYDVQADGYTLDDKRTKLAATHENDNLPDVLERWKALKNSPATELERPRTAQSFSVPKAEIEEQGYDLSLNRYKLTEHVEGNHREPQEIIAELEISETQITELLSELKKHIK
jgi:type I restriction enzyme M protein